MSNQRDRVRKSFEDLSDDEWIPIISVILIGIALLISDFGYYYIDIGMTLLFYAVLVRIWTEIGADTPMPSKREFAYATFLIMSIGAVIIGYSIEYAARLITGDLIAAQSLALSAVISRMYINIQDKSASSIREVLRYNQPVDRYLVLVPSCIAFFFPALIYRVDSYSINFETSTRFLYLVTMCLIIGIGLYYHEKRLS